MKNNSVYKDFGKMLIRLRLEHNMSRVDVAERLGIARNTYGQYERGERKVPLTHAMTLSNLFGFDINEFIENQKEPKVNNSLSSKWYETFCDVTFTESEIDELINFANFLLAKRERD